MILYIHGFGSSGLSGKATLFRDYFKKEGLGFLAPSLPYIPKLAISTLEEIIQKCHIKALIGSSLGGFYSIYLANKYNLKAVLINPSINPEITLKEAIPRALNYFDLSYFDWNESYLKYLKSLKTVPKNEKNFLILLKKGDEVLNYKEAIELMPNANFIIEDGGDHSFSDIDKHFTKIKDFLT